MTAGRAQRIFLLAGEASGDLHGALLAEALRACRPDLEIEGVGGARMEAAGVRLLFRSEELAVVGVFEVLARAARVLRALEDVRRHLGESKPDLFVPIDFPDFNLRLLPAAYRLGIPSVYYISPQVWAWRSGRIELLRRYLRLMVVIFPFEEEIYRRGGVPVRWVGHPFVDRLAPAGDPASERAALGLDSAGPAVALLPGSRRSEIDRIAPVLRQTRGLVDAGRRAAGLPPVRWLVGAAPGVVPERLSALGAGGPEGAGGSAPLRFLSGLDAMRASEVSLAASGTVTLEAALLGRPVVVLYRLHPWTYAAARRLVRVDHIAMANLVAGRRIVPEFVQDAATPEALADEVMRLLSDPEERGRMRSGLLEARARLGPPGAAVRAAEAVLGALDEGPVR